MAQELPFSYVPGKISELLRKISDAKVPDLFSHSFLTDTLGFKSKNDRALVGLLKSLGILDDSGKPTSRYRELKNNSSKGKAVAAGIREAYGPLFAANENAHTISGDDLRGLIAQVSGADKDITARILSTFTALLKESDFAADSNAETDDASDDDVEAEGITKSAKRSLKGLTPRTLNSEFHFNIQVHLPNNGTEETYLNIFNALRETFSE